MTNVDGLTILPKPWPLPHFPDRRGAGKVRATMVAVPCDEVPDAVRGAKVGLLANGTFRVEHAGDDLTDIVRRACRELVALYGEHGPVPGDQRELGDRDSGALPRHRRPGD